MSAAPDPELAALVAAGDAAWDAFRAHRGEAYHAFVPADYVVVGDALGRLRHRAHSFLELGSGVGVVTILADRLGFEACGIEVDPWLVDTAVRLAERFDSGATFAEGSFVPVEFQAEVDTLDTEIPTIGEGSCGYQALGLDLHDFDLVYAFPWPGSEPLFFELLARFGRPDTLFLTYGGLEGCRLWRHGVETAFDSPPIR